MHISKYLVNTHNTLCRSGKISRNISVLGNITNMKTWFSQRVQIRLTLSHFSVKAYGLVFHPWKCGCAFLEVWQSYWHVPVPMAQEQIARGGCPFMFLGALGAVALNKIVTFRACTDKLSRNLTNILKLKEEFQRIISKFGINWQHHKKPQWSQA